MLAPPQARLFGPGEPAIQEEAVNTHSNARFGSEVEWNFSGTAIFFQIVACATDLGDRCGRQAHFWQRRL